MSRIGTGAPFPEDELAAGTAHENNAPMVDDLIDEEPDDDDDDDGVDVYDDWRDYQDWLVGEYDE